VILRKLPKGAAEERFTGSGNELRLANSSA
jgi:hypothetical protein